MLVEANKPFLYSPHSEFGEYKLHDISEFTFADYRTRSDPAPITSSDGIWELFPITRGMGRAPIAGEETMIFDFVIENKYAEMVLKATKLTCFIISEISIINGENGEYEHNMQEYVAIRNDTGVYTSKRLVYNIRGEKFASQMKWFPYLQQIGVSNHFAAQSTAYHIGGESFITIFFDESKFSEDILTAAFSLLGPVVKSIYSSDKRVAVVLSDMDDTTNINEFYTLAKLSGFEINSYTLSYPIPFEHEQND